MKKAKGTSHLRPERLMRRNEFAGRGAVIVGADVGLGPAIIQAFTEADMQIATDGAAAHGVGTVPSQGAEPASISAFFDAALCRIPSLDVLVLAARPVTIRKFLEVSAAHLRSVIEEELVWFALIMQEGARRMIPNGRGRIISLSSMSGKTGVHPNVAPYAAAKGGLIALSRVMAAELGGTGITVNVIANALMQPQVQHLSEKEQAEVVRGIPVGRFGQPEEAAHAVLFLASDRAGYITGETLNLSGGRFMD
jgi:NAD(P)-dependent dehydrogenase (short-subunit alcohol dehydrogenase family)